MTMNTWPIAGEARAGSNASIASQQPIHARRAPVSDAGMGSSTTSVAMPVARHDFEFQPVAQLGQLQSLVLHCGAQCVLPCELAVAWILRQLPQLGDELSQLGTAGEQLLLQQCFGIAQRDGRELFIAVLGVILHPPDRPASRTQLHRLYAHLI